MPLPHLRARGAQYPFADRKNQTAFFSDGNEFVGPEQPQLPMLPSNQRLGADHAMRIHLDHRLVMDDELLPVECVMQTALEREPPPGRLDRRYRRELII